jgi:quinol monooxygenase YgiN
MVVLAVTWKAKQGKEAQTAELFSKLAEESRKEPGCVMYLVHRQREHSGEIFIYEQYKDEAALQAHRDSTHFKIYVGEQLPKFAKRDRADYYSLL